MTDGQSRDDVTVVSEKLQKSLSVNHDDTMETYHRLVQEGKEAARGGDLLKALHSFQQAHNIHRSHKLEGRIQKIQELISQDDSEDGDDEEFVNINNCGLMVYKELHDKLYDYQRDGVAFLYSLHRDGRKGGILADDMGLGKTIQVISFLSGMYDCELVKHTLLIMPTSLITNWTKEFSKWVPGMRVKEFHGISKRERSRNLEKVQTRGGVVITTYNMLINNWQQLASYRGKEFTWDYMILDEAHKIKSTTTKTAKSASAVPSKNRVLLTGTPVQNNLREMWALFDFACQGSLLGTAKTFKAEYENPITRAREKDATPGEKALGFQMSESLLAIIKPHFFRRTKSEVQKNEMNKTPSDEEKPNHATSVPGAVMPTLTRKNDLIIWTYLSAIQERIYRQFISLDHVKELLLTTKSPLAELNILKKICDHPRLLSSRAFSQLGLQESEEADEAVSDAQSIAGVPDATLVAESGKMVFLFALLERLRTEGHRTLVFAHFRKVLDVIERILGNRGFKVLRLDGTITQIAERERRISLFQTDKTYSVFLLTTQVGGVGITLTAANRVVIFDPSWNPATDAQAVDRAYRIGQTENVVIYRLITCSTVEEKIYCRQVFKESLIRQNTGDKKNPFRYFSKQELKELFTLEDPWSSPTQLQLQALHSRHRRTDPALNEHIAHLHTMEMFGISDHDLMFSLDIKQEEAPEDPAYIQGRVEKAQERLKEESYRYSTVSSTEAAWLRLQSESSSSRELPREMWTKKQSPSGPQQGSDGSPPLITLDSSGAEETNSHSHTVVDLTEDEGPTEEPPAVGAERDEPDSSEPQTAHQTSSYLDTDSHQEPSHHSLLLDESMDGAGGRDFGPAEEKVNGHSSSNQDDSLMELDCPEANSLHHKGLSITQAADMSSRASPGFESYNSNFNLQLEDSDMLSRHDDAGPEAEEEKLLAQLQVEGSFDVDRSLSESVGAPARRRSVGNGHAPEAEVSMQLQVEGSFDVDRSLSESVGAPARRRSVGNGHAPEAEVSMDSPIAAVRTKRAAVIYDSEDDEDDDPQHSMKSPPESLFQVLGASTPKYGTPTAPRSRKSVGGNTSVASRRSLLLSIMEDLDKPEEEEEEDQVVGDEDDSYDYFDDGDDDDDDDGGADSTTSFDSTH